MKPKSTEAWAIMDDEDGYIYAVSARITKENGENFWDTQDYGKGYTCIPVDIVPREKK